MNKNRIKAALENFYTKFNNIIRIANDVSKSKGTAYLVGGSVRDMFLNLPLSDVDIEVHNLDIEQLSKILEKYGPVSFVGKSFGVLKLHNQPVDWVLPRTDMPGRKPIVNIDPCLGINEALKRRDLTINAMAINILSGEFIDPFDGLQDLENKVLRSPDIKFFTEDPLRFYRVMHFISRFEMYPDDQLNNVCKSMEISNISVERIESEFEKLMLKSKRPSLGIRWIDSINRLKEVLPELALTKNIKQDPKWHPEGDVFEHLMQSLDAAAELKYKNKNEKLTLLFSALCHDLGKATTTEFVEGMWRSFGHSEAGVDATKSLLKRIVCNKKLIESVCLLVRYHMQPMQFIDNNASLSAYRRLSLKLKGYANLDMLAKLAIADKRGRNKNSSLPLKIEVDDIEKFIKKAKEAEVLIKPEEQILRGRDIMDIVSPGPEMGKWLKYAYHIQLEEGIKDRKILKDRIIEKINKRSLQ